MKILHAVHDFLPRHRAGAEVHVADLCGALAAAGHTPHVLCAEYDPTRAHGTVSWRRHDGIGVTEIVNNWEFADLTEATAPPRLDGVIGHLLDALRPDVVHLHSLFNLSFALPRLAAERGIPCVATLHDYTAVCPSGGKRVHRAEQHVCRDLDPERCARCFAQSPQAAQMAASRWMRPGPIAIAAVAGARLARRHAPALVDRALRSSPAARASRVGARAIERRLADWRDLVVPQVERFVAPSTALALEFRRLGLPASKLEVAAYGIEPFVAVPVARPRRPLRLGFVGSLAWEKGVHRLIAATARLPASAFELQIFGEAPESDYGASLRRMAAGLPVRFHGAFDRDAVASTYAEIDVLIVPSLWLENSPLVIDEAQHAGVPVVGAAIGGISDLVRHGETGLLFDPFAPEALASALAGLLAMPQRVADWARRLPRAKTIEESAAEWQDRYRQVLAAREPRPSREGVAPSRPAPAPATTTAGAATPGATPSAARDRLAAVVVNYRTACETVMAVDSIQTSASPFDPIVVVDNGSEDGSCEMFARRLPGVTLVRRERNSGFSAGVNAGIRKALEAGAGRVLLLNSDALLVADAAPKLMAAIDGDAAVGIAAPTILDATRPGTIASRGILFSPRTGRMRLIEAGNELAAGASGSRPVDGVTGCAMLIAREVFEAVGLFAEDFFFSFEDLDFCLRARRAGFSSVCVLDAVAYHHGSRSIGRHSPRRLYFAARNHLLLAQRGAPRTGALALPRALWIVALNLAFAMRGEAAPRTAGAVQVLRGVGHHLRRRYGSGLARGG
jgi:GT2 family glycosyltransferase/glycosyltransferase involved in cell wall biosynthesis